MKIILLSILILGPVTLCLAENAQPMSEIINASHRSELHKSRDKYRHPLQTLEFFALKNDMTVVEIWPGGGWYTEILAPFLRENGKLYAAHFAANAKVPYFQKSLKSFIEKTQRQPEIYGKIILTELQPPDALVIAENGSVDRILTFRNVHNWMKIGQAPAVFKAMYQALKPGGFLGIVEHRNPSDVAQDPRALSGYVTEGYVISLAENAGFKFMDKAEINANPNDTAEHPEGVWSLPPTLRQKDQDREKYLAIGESDRMTLKFIKP